MDDVRYKINHLNTEKLTNKSKDVAHKPYAEGQTLATPATQIHESCEYLLRVAFWSKCQERYHNSKES